MEKVLDPLDQYVVDFVFKMRIEKGYSQEQIGFIIGVGKQFVNQIENKNHRAKYNIRHINLLADHFGISPKDFFPDKPLVD